jgi:uncharacterized protein involved in response to NO
MLWVLHLAYLWIVVGFALFGLLPFGWVPLGSAVHALTVGALGGVTYGMMTRVSLGHTGRRIRASRPVIGGYLALSAAGVFRVFGPLVLPGWTFQWIIASGILWISAFLIFVWSYAPWLSRPRADGRPG